MGEDGLSGLSKGTGNIISLKVSLKRGKRRTIANFERELIILPHADFVAVEYAQSISGLDIEKEIFLAASHSKGGCSLLVFVVGDHSSADFIVL